MALWVRPGSRNQRKWRGLEWTWYWRSRSRAKGWWTLFAPWRRWDTELKIAIGGEDDMLQLEIGLPLLGFIAVGIALPRSMTKGWVHHRREFGFELRGLRPTLYVGWDEQMGDMSDYYRREYLEQGKPLPDYLNRIKLHPGWKLRVGPRWWWARLKSTVLGAVQIERMPIRTYEDVELALPEGVYVGTVSFYRERIGRPRGRTRRDDIVGEWSSEQWLPFPGKGENSWDCGDDGFKDHTTTIRPYVHEESLAVDAEDVARVISGTVAGVLRYRGRYGGVNWRPEGVGVMK
jgi:hypothetical protein